MLAKPIVHYSFSHRSADEDFSFKNETFFNRKFGDALQNRGLARCMLSFFDAEEAWQVDTAWSDSSGSSGSNSQTNTKRAVSQDALQFSLRKGSYSQITESSGSWGWSRTTIDGSYVSSLKSGYLFFDPLPNVEYPIVFLKSEYELDDETGRTYDSSGEDLPVLHSAFLFKRVRFSKEEILSYKIGGKTYRWASKELALPAAESEFASLALFLAEFYRAGIVEDGVVYGSGNEPYLRFADGFIEEPFPFAEQNLTFLGQRFPSTTDTIQFFDYENETIS